MSLRVVEWGFRNKRLEGYIARDFEPSVLAVQEDLSVEARRARELEARGYEERPLAFKWDEKFCFVAANVLEVDPDAVRALRPSIERDEPGWVESVKHQWPAYRPNIESTAYWAGVPLQATVAILFNMKERGELLVEEN
ncbi:MAG: hypothetical protein M3N16_08945 [Actinomycetota bacterium]|nr:hypothetical protein [Actinomycetota bacterium]